MELTGYNSVNLNDKSLLEDIAECLTKGYDVSAVLFSEKARQSYMKAVRQYYDIEKYDFTAEEIEKVTDWFHVMLEIIPAGYDPRSFLNFTKEQFKEIVQGISTVDVTLCADTEFEASQLAELRKGLEQGIDVTKYAKPEITADGMKILRMFLSEGFDLTGMESVVKKELVLEYLYEAYRELGSAVIEIFQKHRDFYETFLPESREQFMLLMAGQIWNAFEPREQIEYSRVFENTKRKMVETFVAEVSSRGVDAQHELVITTVENFQKLQYGTSSVRTIVELTEENVRKNYLWYFMLMFSRDKHLYNRAFSLLQQTGIAPDDYIYDVEDFHKTETSALFDRVRSIMVDKLQKAGIKVNSRTVSTEMLMNLCEKLKGTTYNEPQLKIYIRGVEDVRRAYLILEYLQKGINIAEFVPSFSKLENEQKRILNSVNCIAVYKQLAEILLKHGVNLFPSVTSLLVTRVSQYSVSGAGFAVHKLRTTLDYIHHFLDMPEGSAQHRCAEFLIDCIERGNYFDHYQIRQLYYGTLHGVDVSKYADPHYGVDVMSAIREGLEQGIDLTPYVKNMDAGDDLRYQLRTVTGMMPQNLEKHIHLQKEM